MKGSKEPKFSAQLAPPKTIPIEPGSTTTLHGNSEVLPSEVQSHRGYSDVVTLKVYPEGTDTL